ncbi:189aa long hypothetical protein [Pyrococcus horikoshii OT3]|uniref:Uncharacterized protein n=1 Tax=Pyrococcus horikoshii (strain ATCC 700860 / DSM 12428 / JCM 9974 / NBRC 100139 / OT-3) TaxID=70601 RepID=O59027_PYRHO|nr:189aa long hypothetical protein [Pyrococcus horikoshii OT3]
MASSRSQGVFVAVSTITFLLLSLNPSISANNVPIILLAASSRLDLFMVRESTSSINITLGLSCLAKEKRAETNFEDSPKYLLRRSLAFTLKNVAFKLFAVALASKLFPVPGGPNRSIPWGGSIGDFAMLNPTACAINFLASFNPPMSFQVTVLFFIRTFNLSKYSFLASFFFLIFLALSSHFFASSRSI